MKKDVWVMAIVLSLLLVSLLAVVVEGEKVQKKQKIKYKDKEFELEVNNKSMKLLRKAQKKFDVESTSKFHFINDHEWAYRKAGVEILRSTRPLFNRGNYICDKTNYTKVGEGFWGSYTWHDCVYYPEQIKNITLKNGSVEQIQVRTITKMDDYTFRITFEDDYDPFYGNYSYGEGVLGYWDFENDLIDNSTNENHFHIKAGTPTYTTCSHTGNHADADQITDTCIDIESSVSLTANHLDLSPNDEFTLIGVIHYESQVGSSDFWFDMLNSTGGYNWRVRKGSNNFAFDSGHGGSTDNENAPNDGWSTGRTECWAWTAVQTGTVTYRYFLNGTKYGDDGEEAGWLDFSDATNFTVGGSDSDIRISRLGVYNYRFSLDNLSTWCSFLPPANPTGGGGCSPSWTNTSWTSWLNESCLITDNMNQSSNRTQWDQNHCGGSENTTFFRFNTTLTCDYCVVNPTNTSKTDWYNITACQTDDTTKKSRNWTDYDSNSCYGITELATDQYTNITWFENSTDTCDYCTPSVINTTWGSWLNTTGVCLANNSVYTNRNRTSWDENSCYGQTGLEADEVNNETHINYSSSFCFLTTTLALSILPSTSVVNGTETTVNGTGCPAGQICLLYHNYTVVGNPNISVYDVSYNMFTYNYSGNVNHSADTIISYLDVTLTSSEEEGGGAPGGGVLTLQEYAELPWSTQLGLLYALYPYQTFFLTILLLGAVTQYKPIKQRLKKRKRVVPA